MMQRFIPVTKEGQLAVGDRILIYSARFEKFFNATVKKVIEVNGNEEIIIDKKNNKYFITKCMLTNTGGFGKWVNNVWIKK